MTVLTSSQPGGVTQLPRATATTDQARGGPYGREVFNVSKFRASIFVDDTDAFLLAFAGAAAIGGVVFVPPGPFNTSATVSWSPGVALRGVGQKSQINYSGDAHAFAFGSQALDVDDPWTDLEITDVRITGTAAGTCGIKVRGATRWSIDRVRVDGFSNGAGILLNGGSFEGRIFGGRYKGNAIGLSAQKQAGDGGAGAGQAFNAVAIIGVEFQNNGYAVQIGDPTTTETPPIVGMGSVMTGCTVQGNTLGGVWNVGANDFSIRDNYFEVNGAFHVRIGSAAGNTSKPVGCDTASNEMNMDGMTGPAIDYVRSQDCGESAENTIYRSTSGAIAVQYTANVIRPYGGQNACHDNIAVLRSGTPTNGAAIMPDKSGHPGIWLPQSALPSPQTLALTAGRTWVHRFVAERDFDLVAIAFIVTNAAGVNDNVQVGIYDAALNKIIASGNVPGKLNALGRQTVALATRIHYGTVYYAAICYPAAGGTVPTLTATVYNNASDPRLVDAVAPEIENFHTNDAALPNALAVVTPGALNYPQLFASAV